ncbi:MAG: hypothetical protein KA066_00605 [Candidatus Pacebacteria bacterium]|nr:hypothetical protein [Candidatus Paceibacterota bacterium]
MNKNIAIAIAVIVVLGLGYWMLMGNDAADTQTPATNTPANGAPAAGTPSYAPAAEPAAFAARAALAAKLGLSAATIAIVQVDEKVWEDGCLGRGNTGEVCTEATVDGYHVTLQARNEVYTYRTNKTGTVVRAEATNN